MIHIALEYNRGFAWSEHGDIWAKGFIYLDGSCITGKALCGYFSDVDSMPALIKKLEQCNGCFSVIISRDDVLLACDPIRMFPLFYLIHGQDIYISDSAEMLARKEKSNDPDLIDLTSNTDAAFTGEQPQEGPPARYLLKTESPGNHREGPADKSLQPVINTPGKAFVNEPAAREFLATGYVTGNETLVSGLYQVQAGEMVHLYGKEKRGVFYSTYQSERYSDKDYRELSDQLQQILDSLFKRLIKSLDGRTVVIPLSGGFDSRLIAAMLKKLGYSHVICYTYGRPGSKDIIPSGKVAGILGYPWKYVEYNHKLINNYLSDPGFIQYYRYSANLVSMFFLQEYFAVRYLTEQNYIPGDSVFVPGHSGDFIAGSMYLKHHLPPGILPGEQIAEKIFDIKYSLCRPAGEEKDIMLARIRAALHDKAIIPGAYAHTIYEDWDVKEKFAKFIVNSCNVYCWFGYEYRLPFWDREFVEFFRSVPYLYKLNKKLYDEVLVNRIFKPMGLVFESEVQPSAVVQKLEYVKSVIRKSLPFLTGKPDRNDPLFYHEMTRMMVDDLQQMEIKIRVQGRAYNSVIVQWYLHQLYEH